MNEKILLSICIPTYNRAHYLKQCLDNIVCQFKDKKIKNSIEIIISDNASTDNTAQIAEKFQKNFDNIKYFQNEKNLGFDKNTINSVVKANGKYCWHIGDDDFIQNGILKFLINFLSKNDVCLLTVKYHYFVDIGKSLKEDLNISEEKNIIYSNSAEEFWLKGYCEGTLGIFIFNRELWLKTDRKSYRDMWAYFEIILKMIHSSNSKLAYLDYPAFFMGQDYKWRENGGELFTHINWIKVLKKLEGFGYDKDFVEQIKKLTDKNFPVVMINAKNNNLNCSFSNLKLIYRELYEHPIQLFFATIIFFIPNSLIKILKSLRNKLKKEIDDNKRA